MPVRQRGILNSPPGRSGMLSTESLGTFSTPVNSTNRRLPCKRVLGSRIARHDLAVAVKCQGRARSSGLFLRLCPSSRLKHDKQPSCQSGAMLVLESWSSPVAVLPYCLLPM